MTKNNVVDELNRNLLCSDNLFFQAKELEGKAFELQRIANEERFHTWVSLVENLQNHLFLCIEKRQLLEQKKENLVSDELELWKQNWDKVTSQIRFYLESLKSICESFGHVFQFQKETEMFDTVSLETSLECFDQYRCLCCGRSIRLNREDFPLDIGFHKELMMVQGTFFSFSPNQSAPLCSPQLSRLMQIQSLFQSEKEEKFYPSHGKML